jgi:succinate-acetate transporter protein
MTATSLAEHQHDGVVRINIRPLATALPLGLWSFGIGMLILAGQSAGWIPMKESAQIGMLMVAFVFPLEGVATIFAFLARDSLAATVLGMFTTSWLALGLALLTSAPGATSIALGFFLLGFAGAVVSMAFAAGTGKPLIATILALSATRAILAGIFEISKSIGLEHAAGYVAAALTALAWYAGTAFLLEDLRQTPLLPVFRRGPAAAAMHGPLRDQLDHASSEAGVRQQL